MSFGFRSQDSLISTKVIVLVSSSVLSILGGLGIMGERGNVSQYKGCLSSGIRTCSSEYTLMSPMTTNYRREALSQTFRSFLYE